MTEGIEALAPHPIGDADPKAVTAAITLASGTSFGPGMRALSRPRREAMWALYAFSRVVDDIADEDWPVTDKDRLLDAWRVEIEALYQGNPVSAIGQALAKPVAAFDLPKAEFLSLIDGMQMDADGPVIAPPLETLLTYTRRVAGTVGMLSMRIFGAWRGETSERFGLALADALQLTNILRDVEEDAAIGRLYLPREMLAAHDVPQNPDQVTGHPGLLPLGAELGAMARGRFNAARAEIPAHDRRTLTPALLMMGVYERYLNIMADTGFSRETPAKLSKTEKLLAGFACVISPTALARDA